MTFLNIKKIIAFVTIFLVLFTNGANAEIERKTEYNSYVNRESDNQLKFIIIDDNLQRKDNPITYKPQFYINEEICLAPFHLVKMTQYEYNNSNETLINKNSILTYNQYSELTKIECSSQIYCNFIPHVFAQPSNSLNKRHYVIWINKGCFFNDNYEIGTGNFIIPRVRYFDDIGEARQYFKKVLDQMSKDTNTKYAILLVSKEGLNILEKSNKLSLDVINFLKGEKVGNICSKFG